MIKRYSCNLSEDFLKDTKITPYWVTGITDGGGKFSITLKSKICYCSFEITQKKVDNTLYMLYFIQEYFNCGEIVLDYKQFDNKYNTYKFIVTNLEDLCNIILPHFDKYPLITSKHLDYLDFKKIVLMCKEGLNLININREKIFSIKNNMNSKRSFDERWYFHDVETQKLNNEWVQAFIDGEGSFQFGIFKTKNRNKSYNLLIPSLEIAQSSHEIKVLNRIKDFFGQGYLKPKCDINDINIIKSKPKVNRYILIQYSIVVNFVDKYPMLTSKELDYQDWKKLIYLKNKGTHNTLDGLLEMRKIKNNMNKHRIRLNIEPNIKEYENKLITSNLSNQLIVFDDSKESPKFSKFKFYFSKNLKKDIFIYIDLWYLFIFTFFILYVLLGYLDYIYNENYYLNIIDNLINRLELFDNEVTELKDIKNKLESIADKIIELENKYENKKELNKIEINESNRFKLRIKYDHLYLIYLYFHVIMIFFCYVYN